MATQAVNSTFVDDLWTGIRFLAQYRSCAAALGAQPARVELQRRFRQREADFLVAVKDLIFQS